MPYKRRVCHIEPKNRRSFGRQRIIPSQSLDPSWLQYELLKNDLSKAVQKSQKKETEQILKKIDEKTEESKTEITEIIEKGNEKGETTADENKRKIIENVDQKGDENKTEIIEGGEKTVQKVKKAVEKAKDEVIQKGEEAKDEIIDTLTKKERKVTKSLSDSHQAPKDLVNYLLSLEKPLKMKQEIWSRNRIAVVLLKYLDTRAKDIKRVTLGDIERLIQGESIYITHSKTGKEKEESIQSEDRQDFEQDYEKIKTDIKIVFGGDQNKILGSKPWENTELSKSEWLEPLNNFIKLGNPKYKLTFSSHSFRIKKSK
jgi:hypothetical protein